MARLHLLNCVPDAIKDRPRYVGDHVIRHYQDKTIEELFNDLGEECPDSYTISGGIGSLTMTKQGNTFVSSLPDRKPEEKIPKPTQAEIDARIAVCNACEYLQAESDKCRMCGCGAQITERTRSQYANCPLRKWAPLQSQINQ